MRIKVADLKRIQAGEISLAYRCWRRPTVRAGGTLQTAVGLLAIEAVDEVSRASITVAEAKKAGYATRAELLRALERREGTLVRVRLAYLGDDPRRALRETSNLSDDERAAITEQLERWDTRAKDGAWTGKILAAIDEQPATRAPDLASALGFETKRFKSRVRQLKGLGLTESLEVGYRLSPRGRAWLDGSA